MSENRLTAEQEVFLVQALARFEAPTESATALKLEHGAEISPHQGAEVYDPTKRAGERLSQRWRELF